LTYLQRKLTAARLIEASQVFSTIFRNSSERTRDPAFYVIIARQRALLLMMSVLASGVTG